MSDEAMMIVQHLRASGALAELAYQLATEAASVEAATQWETITINVTDEGWPAPGWEPFGVLPETAARPAQIVWRRRV